MDQVGHTNGTLESYNIVDFTRLSLQVPELDDLYRGLLFVKGLRPDIKRRSGLDNLYAGREGGAGPSSILIS